MSPTPTYIEPQPQRSGLLTALFAGALIALVAANIYLYVQIDHLRTDLAKTHDQLLTELSNVRDASSVTTQAQMRHLETLKEELEAARAQARTMSNQSKVEAQAHADQLARQLEAEQAKVAQQVSSQGTEITAVRQQASTTNAKIADVSTDVGTVRSQVSQTQAQLDKTIADLKSTRGDLGVQSGLIATNAQELAALRRLGERNYFEFKLGKEAEKKPARVGDITVRLRKADAKHGVYTVDLVVDDRPVEKKDKTVNEPVQFYASKGGHIPYELVVNSVGKDSIAGYLSTPKEQATR